MSDTVLPPASSGHRTSFARLAGIYKAINAPLGALGVKTLEDATAAIEGGNGAYLAFQAQLKAVTGERNTIAGHMIQMMEGAEFTDLPFNDVAAQMQATSGQSVLDLAP